MLVSLWPNWWHQWNLYHKVTFDGENQLIIINHGETNIDVKEDIYSAWKEWASLVENSHWLPAMRAVGGDPTVSGRYLGSTFFLINGWKMRTWEGDHKLLVSGNIYSEDGGAVFIPTINSYNTEISITTSNLVDTVAGGGGGGVDLDILALVNAIWNKQISTLNTEGTIGKLITLMEQKIDDTEAILITKS